MELVMLVSSKDAEGSREHAGEGLMDTATNFAVSLLATKLSERPESLGTDSVYSLL